MKKRLLIFLLLAHINSFGAIFSENSITLLRGDNFKVGPDSSRTELTYESLSVMKYGDSFFWIDMTNPGQASDVKRSSGSYAEWSPRLSLGKTFGFIKGDGLLKDILFSHTFEFGSTNLHGFGFDFNLPGFSVFQWNFYVRDDLNRNGTSTQSTFVYSLPFSFGLEHKLLWNAYIDIVHADEGDEGDGSLVKAHYHTGQQLLWDLNYFYTGFEYQVWDTKYGIKDGEKEYNLKYLIKMVF